MSWNDWIIGHELVLRLGFFFGVFLLVATWEIYRPRRQLRLAKVTRWSANLGLLVLNSLVLRLLFPAAAVGAAVYVEQQSWGIFHTVQLPMPLTVLLCVVLLDLFIYLQHLMMHAIPMLWRLHRVHHADMDYDLTTGTRFHSLEIILSMLFKFCVIAVLGAPVVAVIIFEILLNACAMFNHGNITLPKVIDRSLRYLLVTPDMHRVHHSVSPHETHSNFGFCLPWWDRLFRTYVAQPSAGHQHIDIGLPQYRDPKETNRLSHMLMMPFKR